MIFLDSAATTPVRREVLEAMWPLLTGDFGNPSSHHELGESAKRALDAARTSVAASLGCRASDVVFTSGGTESDNLAIKGLALAEPRGRHIVTSAIEHEAVLESVDYLARIHDFEVTVLPVDAQGLINLDQARDALRPDTTLCTVMYANNEIGAVQPIAALAELCRAHGVPLHTDAVQAAGWLSLDVAGLGIDALSLSGHKLGAPKGIGVLMVKGRRSLEPVLHGGGQERGKRSGTENVAGAVGFAHALALAETDRAERAVRIAQLRDDFVADVLARVPAAIFTGPALAGAQAGADSHARADGDASARTPTPTRLPNNASFCFPGTSGESLLLELGRAGVICSAGSACAVGSDDVSHVLTAIGIDEAIAQTAVRFSLSGDTTAEQLATVAAEIETAYRAVRSLSQ
ncbi:cysteine desulfurase [Salinibacterium amurskyense]|uniref:cysteine desulfurase n=1 Tax=Salinibacterium amurskyense TaxID=205941 RepID=A0A2M9D8Z3_9MICO|nr:cysteine desulfurase family protein [Salinibacterium amurskyense]PJJ82185.1 cysteine desulfurase [Salinibacterium amurskyense]RLQ81959.1 cysteine desulfurase [Salinibacterium amurskyense]GHD77852.1 cysteine desulfurase [Salinibacterium amurskyense]